MARNKARKTKTKSQCDEFATVNWGRIISDEYPCKGFDSRLVVYANRTRVNLISESGRATRSSRNKDKAHYGNKEIHDSAYVVERKELIRYEPTNSDDSSLFEPLKDCLTGSIPLPNPLKMLK
jgi:hypothetical protein